MEGGRSKVGKLAPKTRELGYGLELGWTARLRLVEEGKKKNLGDGSSVGIVDHVCPQSGWKVRQREERTRVAGLG